MAQGININKYVAEAKKRLNISISDEILEKDLYLTLVLSEFAKRDIGGDLIFKGGTLLSSNYLDYHRFSEDLDFVYKYSGELHALKRKAREKRIKEFMDWFVPELKKASDALNLEFSSDRSNARFCTILHGRSVYIFRLYYSDNNYIKIEINFVEKMLYPASEMKIKAITDYFDSRELLFSLGLKIDHLTIMCYSLDEIILEKYRAILTRKDLKERDIFDLYLMKKNEPDINKVVEKIQSSSLIKKNLEKIIREKSMLLQKGEFFGSEEDVAYLAIAEYDRKDFGRFKDKMKPGLMEICRRFLDE